MPRCFQPLQGLNPQLFWRHRVELLSCSREELEVVVARLVAAVQGTEPEHPPGSDGLPHETSEASWQVTPSPVLRVGGRVLLCSLTDLPRDLPVRIPSPCGSEADDGETAFVIVYASDTSPGDTNQPQQPTEAEAHSDDVESEIAPLVLHLHLPTGRRGRHMFVHYVLPRAVSFARSHLSFGRKLCVAGGDEGIGVALVLLQLFFDDAGCLRIRSGTTTKDDSVIGKSSVRTRLEWIIASRPQVNPTRAILKRVNDYLLSPRLRSQEG